MMAAASEKQDGPAAAIPDMGRAAAAYAALGWRILPVWPIRAGRCGCGKNDCPSPGKHPITNLVPNGLNGATNDVATIRGWWERVPDANIATIDWLRIDVDIRGGGLDAWGDLVAMHGRPDTVECHTPSGGRHFYFQPPAGWKPSNKTGQLPAGIDVRGAGTGYTLLPPSNHMHGDRYVWEASSRPGDVTPAPLPPWLVDMLRPDEGERPRPAVAIDADEPVELDRLGLKPIHLAAIKRPPVDGEDRSSIDQSVISALVAHGATDGQIAHIFRNYPIGTGGKFAERGATYLEISIANARRWLAGQGERVNGHVAAGGGGDLHVVEHCTDWGNARRLVRHFGDRLRYVAEHGAWYVWDGRIWKRDTTGEVYRLAKKTIANIYVECANIPDDNERKTMVKHALRSEAAGRLEAMLAVAESEGEVALPANKLDAHPWLLVARNGTIDLRTGELGPHDSRHLITRMVDVDYDPAAGCPTWLQFLDTIFDHDTTLIGFIQRAAGYSLTGDVSEQCLFYLHGKGRNGKSTLIDILAAAAGDYFQKLNTEALLVKTFGGIPNDIAMLPGARMVTAAEVEGGRRLAESLVKDLTGGDAIQARFMRAEWFTFKPQFKLWLYGNHKAHIRGTDDGIWRRIRLIPFNVQIPERAADRRLGEKLRAELPGILPWMVQGCLEWQKHGLGEPAAVAAATRTYREEEDFLGEFLADACERRGAATERAADLFNAYREWCRQGGERETTQRTFGLMLRERGFDRERQRDGHYWIGLELNEHGRDLREKWELRGEK